MTVQAAAAGSRTGLRTPHRLVRMARWPRTVGYSFAWLVMASAFLREGASWLAWLGSIVTCLVWPQAMHYAVRLTQDQKRSEYWVLVGDGCQAGFWAGALGLQLWPATAFVLTNLLNAMMIGGPRLLGKGLLGAVAGSAVGLCLVNFQVSFDSPPATALLSALLVVSYSLLLTHTGYRAAVELRVARRGLASTNAELDGLASKLAKYLSPQIYSAIFSGRHTVALETKRKPLTVFFSDIVGFTELSETLEPEALASLLNDYLREMTNVALAHGGTVDKFIGDAVMIFFGDPETKGEQDDAVACVDMAVAMRERLSRMRWADARFRGLHVRMGVHSGSCTVGNFGADHRMDYTIVGSAVNLASRLESAAKPDEILMSKATYELVRARLQCAPRGELRLKGVAGLVEVFGIA